MVSRQAHTLEISRFDSDACYQLTFVFGCDTV